ncbi:MAG: hypothetical protein MI745_14165 [Pseudomonadales bacterium]|nr:hypothetical protein [Pseudomonadales bacterium]
MPLQIVKRYGETINIEDRKSGEVLAQIAVDKESKMQFRAHIAFNGDKIKISKNIPSDINKRVDT